MLINALKFLWLPGLVLALFAFNGINLLVFVVYGLFKILFFAVTSFSGVFGLLLSSVIGAYLFEKIEDFFDKKGPKEDVNEDYQAN